MLFVKFLLISIVLQLAVATPKITVLNSRAQ
jgi:hypothetical protein